MIRCLFKTCNFQKCLLHVFLIKTGFIKIISFSLSRNRKNHSHQNNVLLSGRFMHRKNCTVKMLTAKEKQNTLTITRYILTLKMLDIFFIYFYSHHLYYCHMLYYILILISASGLWLTATLCWKWMTC